MAASAVSLACPNVYDAPPGDRDADAMRERPAYEVQAYLGYTWGDEQEAFVEGALACGLNDHTFGQVDHDEDWGVVNADQCVDLKACLDEQGITFPDEWPETSYFDLLPEDEDICGLQTLQ